MDGGTDVGPEVSIDQAACTSHAAGLLMGDGLRTQVQPIWEQQIQQQADCHAGKHHRTQIKVIGAVTPQQGDQCPGNQEKPGAVSKDEPFVEGNPVIQCTVNQIDRFGNQLFKCEETDKVKDEKDEGKRNRMVGLPSDKCGLAWHHSPERLGFVRRQEQIRADTHSL